MSARRTLEKILQPASRDGAVPSPASGRLGVLQQHVWHSPRLRQEAEERANRVGLAHRKGQPETAEAEVIQLVRLRDLDRVEKTLAMARVQHLFLEPVGSGPLPDRPFLLPLRHNDWRVYPLGAYHGIEIPSQARDAVLRWEALSLAFDRYYVAEEVSRSQAERLQRTPTARLARLLARALGWLATHGWPAAGALGASAALVAAGGVAVVALPVAALAAALAVLDPCLIGVLSSDGENGQWLVLARWDHPINRQAGGSR